MNFETSQSMPNLVTTKADTHGRPRSKVDAHASFHVAPVREHERPGLLRWLDHGLRGGREGRLEAEFAPVLFHGDPLAECQQHVLVREGEQLASHCLTRCITVEAVGRRIELGMVGMVYTDPAARGRGAARLAVEAGIDRLRERGASVAVLWSDLDAFYNRQGFHRAGIENFYVIDRALCQRAQLASDPTIEVQEAQAHDWFELEALYASKPTRHVREPGELRRLAVAPECETRVARRDQRVLAYASMGRGDDLSGVVHEWAGDAEGVGACIESFARERDELIVLEGPIHERATVALRRAGARPNPGSFGLMKILDVDALWKCLSEDVEALTDMRLTRSEQTGGEFVFEMPGRRIPLSAPSALSLLFGPALPRSLALGLNAATRNAIGRHLPWPLFIWGFDSI